MPAHHLFMLQALSFNHPARPVSPHTELARLAVFGEPSVDWTFVEAGSLAWQQWCDFCRSEIGREPAVAHVFAHLPGRSFGRYRGRSLPMARPPGAPSLDRMRIASGEREDT